jgi:hypothetical protein
MALPKFYVEANPFTNIASVRAKIEGETYAIDVEFFLPDYWASFAMGKQVFDIHFSYEGEFCVSVYSGEDDGLMQGAFPVKLTIKLKD